MSLSPGSSLPEATACLTCAALGTPGVFLPLASRPGKGRGGVGGSRGCLERYRDLPHVLTTPCALSGVSHGFHPVAEATQDPPPCFPKGAVTPHAPQLCLEGRQLCDPGSERP